VNCEVRAKTGSMIVEGIGEIHIFRPLQATTLFGVDIGTDQGADRTCPVVLNLRSPYRYRPRRRQDLPSSAQSSVSISVQTKAQRGPAQLCSIFGLHIGIDQGAEGTCPVVLNLRAPYRYRPRRRGDLPSCAQSSGSI
jgi:hypothetical protein